MKIKTEKRTVSKYVFKIPLIKLPLSETPKTAETLPTPFQTLQVTEIKPVEIKPPEADDHLLLLDQIQLDPNAISDETSAPTELIVTSQVLILKSKELKNFKNPKYHHRILAVDDLSKKKKIQLILFKFSEKGTHLTLNQEFVDVALSDQLLNDIKIRINGFCLEVLLTREKFGEFLTLPPRKIPDILYKYCFKLTFQAEEKETFKVHGYSKFTQPCALDVFTNIFKDHKHTPSINPERTPDSAELTKMVAILKASLASTHHIQVYDHNKYQPFHFLNNQTNHYLSLTDSHIYHKYTLPSRTITSTNLIFSSLGDKSEMILNIFNNPEEEEFFNQLGKGCVILTFNPSQWKNSFHYLTEKKIKLIMVQNPSDLKQQKGCLYVVRLRKDPLHQLNQKLLFHLRDQTKKPFLILDQINQLPKWNLNYPFLSEFHKCYLENPLNQIKEKDLLNLKEKEEIVQTDGLRIAFYNTVESLGLNINIETCYLNNCVVEPKWIEEIESDETCPICFDSYYLAKLECNHFICPDCLKILQDDHKKELESSLLAKYGYDEVSVQCPCCRRKVEGGEQPVYKIKSAGSENDVGHQLILGIFTGQKEREVAHHLLSIKDNLTKILFVVKYQKSLNSKKNNMSKFFQKLYQKGLTNKLVEINYCLQTAKSSDFSNHQIAGTDLVILFDNVPSYTTFATSIYNQKDYLHPKGVSPEILSQIKPLGYQYHGTLQVENIIYVNSGNDSTEISVYG